MVSKLADAIGGSSYKKIKQAKIDTPPIQPATPMPDPEEERKKALMATMMQKRGGRDSTLLTDDENKL